MSFSQNAEDFGVEVRQARKPRFGLRVFRVMHATQAVAQPSGSARLELMDTADLGTLTGLTYRRPYDQGAGPYVAECGTGTLNYLTRNPKVVKHQSPPRMSDPKCGCGFWQYYGATAEGDEGLNQYAGFASVFVPGIVSAWGRVRVGELGMRSQKMTIVALVLPPRTLASDPKWSTFLKDYGADLSNAIRARYDVPVFPSVLAAVSNFPLSDPYALRDKSA